jgi:hypothetical protein
VYAVMVRILFNKVRSAEGGPDATLKPKLGVGVRTQQKFHKVAVAGHQRKITTFIYCKFAARYYSYARDRTIL